MPVKVCIWNIQNYGRDDPLRWGAASRLRNSFIRDFVFAHTIDVLFIIEATSSAEPSLVDLCATLNRHLRKKDWSWSFCGGSLNTDANPPASKDDMGFRSDGRSEGYAVLWRSSQADRFEVLPGLNDIAVQSGFFPVQHPAPNPLPNSPLNVVTRGRPNDNAPTQVIQQGPKRRRTVTTLAYRALGGYTSNGVFPYREDHGGNPGLMNEWPPLLLPGTSRNLKKNEYKNSRRPAYVVLNLTRPGAASKQRLCPVIAYHAPSNEDLAAIGVVGSGMGRELYVTDDRLGANPNALVYHENVVCGGDYNFHVEEDFEESEFKYYVNGFEPGRKGGADCEAAPPPNGTELERHTNVRLLGGWRHNIVIDTEDLDGYLHKSLDLIFTRLRAGGGERPNTLSELGAPANAYEGTIRALRLHVETYVIPRASGGVDDDAGPLDIFRDPIFTGNWGARFVSWKDFYADLAKGRTTSKRRAAELYQIFISDHLPLVAEIQL